MTLAAELLEASPDDVVVLDEGRLGVAGVPARGALGRARDVGARERAQPLADELDFDRSGVVPVRLPRRRRRDRSRDGTRALRDIVAVDDCGVVINPLLAEGQVHGGLAQGVAQILFEGVRYDDDGNPLTATLVDYLVPSAADLPSFTHCTHRDAEPSNPLGAKGIGESGTTGSIGAFWNAVVDALAPLGIRHLDPPFTPRRVWRAMQDASVSSAGRRHQA